MPLIAILFSAVPARAWLAIGVALAALAAIGWLRHDAARDARNTAAVESAQQERVTRERAEDAARDASRDDVLDRLRTGRF